MNISIRTSLIIFSILLLATFGTSWIYYGEITLLSFINTSFIISSVFIFISLFTLVVQKGFFDGITYSFRRIFASSQPDKELEEDIRNEMRPPSELLQPVSTQQILLASLLLLICMLIALFMYYNS
jgi:membrane protein YdbS with pleckstrin-like domain